MAFPVTLNGRTYTLADFEGQNYAAGFPDALQDFVTDAGTSVTAAAASATAAAASETAAAASAAAAAASVDAIEGFYLGAQASNPTVDLNGAPVTVGDFYFNTATNQTRIYDGSNWNAIEPDLVGDASPQLGGTLDFNGNIATSFESTGIDDNATSTKLTVSDTGISVTGNIGVTGTVDGRNIATDGTKLDGIESGADVTDAANVALAGAVMDGDFTANGFMKRTGAGIYTVDTSTYLTSVSVSGLSDTTITSVSNNEVLAYDSTANKWINQTAAEAGLLTGNQTITLSGDLSGSGTTSINAQIAANVVGANELNVSGNGTTAQFLRSDGDGTFTWATPTDTNTTYSAGTGLTLSTTTFSVNYGTTSTTACVGNDSRLSNSRTCNNTFDNAATSRTNLGLGSLATLSAVGAAQITDNTVGAAELNVSGNGTTSQFLRSDGDGSFTWATPTDTNTTYSAGAGLTLTGTSFSIQSDLRDNITYVGLDSGDYLQFSNNISARLVVNGTERFRADNAGAMVTGRLDVSGDIYAADQIIHTDDTDTYMQFNAANTWRVVAGGTEAMRVSGGVVGIGTINPNTTSSLDVENNRSFQLRVSNTTTSAAKIGFANSSSTTGAFMGGNGNSLIFETNGQNERARIDTHGSFGVGDTTPASRAGFSVNKIGSDTSNRISVAVKSQSNSYLRIGRFASTVDNLITIGYNYHRPSGTFTSDDTSGGTSGITFRADGEVRIETGGIGSTSPTESFVVQNNGVCHVVGRVAGTNLIVENPSNGGSQGGQVLMHNTWSSATNGRKYLRVDDAGSWQVISNAYSLAIITASDGGVCYQGNNSSTWTTVSDIRLKDNVREINDAVGKMMALNPCHFEYKKELGKTQTGFIAQEFEQVFAGHVHDQAVPMGYEEYLEEGDTTIKAIDANLIPYLVKAIQEQQAMIATLQAEVAVLKGE